MDRPPLPIPLEDITTIGPYFAVTSTGTRESAGWLRMRSLIDDRDDLSRIIDDVAAGLGTRERWIAASIFYQGLAARLTSIYVASAALCGQVPDLGADHVSFRLRQPGPVELDVAPLRSVSPAEGWHILCQDQLGPLAAAIRGQVRIGAYLLLGNLSSALAGALAVVAGKRQIPLDTLLRHDWAHPASLATAGRWLRTPDGLSYARRTCCGYEQLDQGGRCGDCSLNWHGSRWPVLRVPSEAPGPGSSADAR